MASANAQQLITPPAEVDDIDVGKIISALKPARFIVDVKRIKWKVSYLTDLTRYGAAYVAKACLIKAGFRKFIAQGFCSHRPTYADGAPAYDELVANGAALVKEALAVAGAACLEKIETKIFKL